MSPGFRHRPVPPSPLSRWDARWKLAAVLLAAAAAAALRHPAPSAAALAVGLGLLRVGRLGGPWVRVRLGAFALAAVPFLLVLPFTLDPAGPGWDVGPVRVSEQGVLVGAGVVFRGVAIGALALVLVGTAPVHHTLAAAHRLKVPGLLVLVTLLAYRYAFLLADELRRLRVALRVRGFRPRADRHGYRTAGHVVGAVLVRGADRAERVSEAMRARGFDGRFHTLTAFRTTAWDVIGFVPLPTAMVLLLAWDRLTP
ncbi:MAG TPA: cobalt ECF transporter T component CbiQ [Urbifossiella sp.]|jgi:cobalt/nickel transport system permease protein|nr:cobalt ECF transporter T component CbiQ [Urbifossiella sp.]